MTKRIAVRSAEPPRLLYPLYDHSRLSLTKHDFTLLYYIYNASFALFFANLPYTPKIMLTVFFIIILFYRFGLVLE